MKCQLCKTYRQFSLFPKQPTKAELGRASLPRNVPRRGLAPFPGPAARSFSSPGGLIGAGTPPELPVFSPQDSSEGEDRSAQSRSPSPECPNRNQNGVLKSDYADGDLEMKENGDLDQLGSDDHEVCLLPEEVCVLPAPSQGKNGVSGSTTGSSQGPAKIKSLAAHLSTILLSEDVTAVISSAQ